MNKFKPGAWSQELELLAAFRDLEDAAQRYRKAYEALEEQGFDLTGVDYVVGLPQEPEL